MDEIKYYFVLSNHNAALQAAISINNLAIKDGYNCIQPFNGQYDPDEEQVITDYYHAAITAQPAAVQQHLKLTSSVVKRMEDDETMLDFIENMDWPEETLKKIKEVYHRRNGRSS